MTNERKQRNMKRFIRTKDGSVFDTTKYIVTEFDTHLDLSSSFAYWLIEKNNIVTESDDVLDLIQIGDLIEEEKACRKLLDMYNQCMTEYEDLRKQDGAFDYERAKQLEDEINSIASEYNKLISLWNLK